LVRFINDRHANINPVTAAAFGYVSTILSLFKLLFESPQLMVSTVKKTVDEDKSDKDLIASMGSVLNLVNEYGMPNSALRFSKKSFVNTHHHDFT